MSTLVTPIPSGRLRKPASVCGDLAGDPAMAVILLGMGYTSVSVAPHFLGEIKYAVRSISHADAARFAEEALSAGSAAAVRDVIARLRERLYDDHRADVEHADA